MSRTWSSPSHGADRSSGKLDDGTLQLWARYWRFGVFLGRNSTVPAWAPVLLSCSVVRLAATGGWTRGRAGP